MSGGTYDFVVMGGGHNGLLSSIYLAKAGYKVCVLEALDEFGGGTRSGEIAPGYIADQGGMVHNLISRTPIVREDGAVLEVRPGVLVRRFAVLLDLSQRRASDFVFRPR